MALLLAGCNLFHSRPDTVPAPKHPSGGGITSGDLLSHAEYLAGDSLYGRRAGTSHGLAAAEYIRSRFQSYGLQPADSGYFQPFTFTAAVEMGPENRLSFTSEIPATTDGHSLVPGEDFQPLGFSSSGVTGGPLVFVGYGIISEDPVYDDYDGVEVSGKVVMLLRNSPDGTNPHGAFGKHTPLRKKVLKARENGAVAVLVVTGPVDDEEDILMKLRFDQIRADAGLPVINVSRKVADRILQNEGTTIGDLQREINTSRMPISHALEHIEVSVTTDIIHREAESRNVLAVLPGSGPLRDQWIVLGAHYDHLGWGGEGSGSLVPDTTAIHNGADDNASGTAGLLELAEYFATGPPGDNRRSIIFMAFGAEELGLLGSAYYTKNPILPLENVTAMINMDMIGGMKEKKLVIGGAGTSPLWKELLPALNQDSLSLSYDDGGFGSSDHQSFYLQDIPVLFLFTGQHERYHRPTDDVEFLNLEGMRQVIALAARIVNTLAERSEAPEFAKVESSQSTRGGFSVIMGAIPDYTYEGDGMRISGVRGGGPADKGGLKGGDIIVQFGSTEVKSIYDYMYALQEAKAGESVKVVVRRTDGPIELEVVPERRRD